MRTLVVVILVMAASVVSRATVIVPTDLAGLARDARTIARGRVVAVDAGWTDDRRTIETTVTLDVDEYLKGPLGPTLQFRVPGGSVGRYRRVFVGAPDFAIDDRAIVFLTAWGPGVPYLLGLSQGVFRLTQGDRSLWIVTPPPVLPTAGAIVRGDPVRRPMALQEFERRVRDLVGAVR